MTTATKDRPSTAVNARRPTHSALAVVVTAIGVFWPGGHIPMADQLFTLAVLAAIFGAVTRYPGFKELVAAAPSGAKWGAKALLGALLIGQLWGVSAHTFPLATWTMYSDIPTATAAVYRFDAVTADGESVTFTPSAWNRTLPAKMALAYLRSLSVQVYRSSLGTDADQHAADEDALRRVILVYVELHNAMSPDSQPVSVNVSQVTYDVTQDDLTIESGEQTVLLHIDLEAS